MGRTVEGLDQSGAGLFKSDDEAFDSMLVVGEKPWHYAYNEDIINLQAAGVQVQSADVNKYAGLDWSCSLHESAEVLQKPFRGLESDRYVVRDDKNLVIGRVKAGYELFQNEDGPSFLDSLVDSGDLNFVTAGSLYAGARVWWLAQIPKDITIGGESVESYLLLMDSHDGSVSLTACVTPILVVCQNTLNYGLSSAKRMIKIRHTKNATEKWNQARKALEIGWKYTEALAEVGDRLLDVKISDDEFAAFLNTLAPLPTPNEVPAVGGGTKIQNQPAITMKKQVHDKIVDIYNNHPSQQEKKGTLWGAVQAVGFYSDHVSAKKSFETGFSARVFGKTLGADAFDIVKDVKAKSDFKKVLVSA